MLRYRKASARAWNNNRRTINWAKLVRTHSQDFSTYNQPATLSSRSLSWHSQEFTYSYQMILKPSRLLPCHFPMEENGSNGDCSKNWLTVDVCILPRVSSGRSHLVTLMRSDAVIYCIRLIEIIGMASHPEYASAYTYDWAHTSGWSGTKLGEINTMECLHSPTGSQYLVQ